MPEALPLFPLNTVLFPDMLLPLHIFEERYRRMLRERLEADPVFGVIHIARGVEVAAGDRTPELSAIGTASTLVASGEYPDGRWDIVVRGTRRFRMHSGHWESDYLTAEVSWLPDIVVPSDADQAMLIRHDLITGFERFIEDLQRLTGSELDPVTFPDDPLSAAWELASIIPVAARDRQRLLEMRTLTELSNEMLALLKTERGMLRQLGTAGTLIDHPGRRFSAN